MKPNESADSIPQGVSPEAVGKDQNRKRNADAGDDLQHLIRAPEAAELHWLFLSQLIKLIPVGIAVHVNGVTKFINPAGIAMMKGRDASDFLGKPAIEFVHPDSRSGALERIGQLLQASDESLDDSAIAPYVEEHFIRLDGEAIEVEVAALPIQLPHLENAIMVIFRDITERKRQRMALQQREARFRQLVSLLPDAAIIHKDAVIIFANDAALRLMKAKTSEDIVGHEMWEFLHADEIEGVKQRLSTLFRHWEPLPVAREYMKTITGDIFLAEINAFPFVEDGQKEVLVIVRDITERERLLDALMKSEAKFRTLAESLPATVFIVNEDGQLAYLNVASEQIWGYPLHQLMQIDYRDLLSPEALQMASQHTDDMDMGESVHFELPIIDSQGHPRWLDVTFTKTIIDEKVVGLGVGIDITQRKSFERALQRLAQKLASAYEDERRHIARELHDEIGQRLIGMKFALEAVQRAQDPSIQQQAIADARSILADLTEDVRELALSFRPTMLDDLGLLPTLLWLFERFSNRTGIRVDFSHEGIRNRRFAQASEITAFRVVQEALTNVARYAQVNQVAVMVKLDEVDNRLRLEIQDEGVGFTPEQTLQHHESSGLSSMKERVELIGGAFSVRSAPQEGTTISATIPLFEINERRPS